jgi:hypothetical protein
MDKRTKVPHGEVEILIENPVLASPGNKPRLTTVKVDLEAVRTEIE